MGGNRLQGSCGDVKTVPQQNAINANASLALHFLFRLLPGQDPLYKGGNRLQGSCGDFKMVPQQNAINANASLALPFFGCCPVRTPCIREETAYREAAVISKVVHDNKLCRTALLILPSSKPILIIPEDF